MTEANGFSIWQFLTVSIRYRKIIVGLPVLFGSIVAIYLLTSSRLWSSTAGFLPAAPTANRAGVSAIAQQFGIDLGVAGDPGQSSQFYEDLITSPEIMRAVVTTPFRKTAGDSSRATLLDIFGTDSTDALPVRREAAIKSLSKRLETSSNPVTGEVTLTVHTEWPVLSQAVAARLLELVNAFNNQRIRQQAEARREFTAIMVDSSKMALRAVEDQLQGFLQRNRMIASDQQLVFERDRLLREVEMRQSVYTSLVSSYEQARIDAVRDTPLITVVESPVVAATPDKRGTVMKTLAALFLGLILALTIAVSIESLEMSRRRHGHAFEDFVAAKDSVMSDLRKAFGRKRPPKV
jgi:uncharacterized protein involved in exopolysaccharide biosynthesis